MTPGRLPDCTGSCAGARPGGCHFPVPLNQGRLSGDEPLFPDAPESRDEIPFLDSTSLISRISPEWQSGLDSGVSMFLQAPGDRSYSGVFGGYFRIAEYLSESETGKIRGENRLNIPYWTGDRLFDGLYHGEALEDPFFFLNIFSHDEVFGHLAYHDGNGDIHG